MMQEIRLDMPCEASKSSYDDYVKYYTTMQDSKRQRSSLSTSSTVNSYSSNTTFMEEKQVKANNRRRCIAAALVITIVALSAFIVTAFLFDLPKFANELATKSAAVDSNNINESTTTSNIIEEKSTTKNAQQNENVLDNDIGIHDSQPSGFASQVDYVMSANNDVAEFELGVPQPNVITVAENMTPTLEKQLLEQLYSEFPEMFEQYSPDQQNTEQQSDMPRLPPGATGFSMPVPTNLDDFKLMPSDDNENGFVIASPHFTAANWEYELKEPLIDDSEDEFVPPPPPGAWSIRPTPPPPPMADRPKIIFQENAPSLEWEGPNDGTWFHQPIEFNPATPKETVISAPWLGDDCTIVTAINGESKVKGSDKCDQVVWYPYHYDVYPDSKATDWVYIDMKEGERNMAWPGAGPFRKIDQTPRHSSLRSGPICLDLPPMPLEYRGPIPDEFDCAAIMMRVKGFGDNKEYAKIDVDMPQELQKSSWDFAWRQI